MRGQKGRKIRYDEAKGAEYVRYRGKKVYGSWNEMKPNRKNRVKAKGLKNHIIQDADGTHRLDERSWDKKING
jgi:hypothetical protein